MENKKIEMVFMTLLMLTIITVSGISYAKTFDNSQSKLWEAVQSLNTSNVMVLDAQNTRFSVNSIKVLFIDGSWLTIQNMNPERTQQLRNIVRNSVPVIIVGGDPNLIYRIAESGRRCTMNSAPLACGAFFDGKKTSYLFEHGVCDLSWIVNDSYKWSIGKLQISMKTPVADSADNSITSVPQAYWEDIGDDGHSYDYGQYGTVYIVDSWSRLAYDQSPYYDWFSVTTSVTCHPGNAQFGNDWRTADVQNYNWMSTVVHNSDSDLITRHGPTTTSDETTVSYTLGIEAGAGKDPGAAVSATYSVSYTVGDVKVYDQSDLQNLKLCWFHDLNDEKNVACYDYTFIPGFTARMLPLGGYNVLEFVEEYYVNWIKPNLNYPWPASWWYAYHDHESIWYAYMFYNFRSPDIPSKPSGPESGFKNTEYQFSTSTSDPNGNAVQYRFDWGDGIISDWTGNTQEDNPIVMSHSWSNSGSKSIRAQAREFIYDDYYESGWSDLWSITISDRAPNAPSAPGGRIAICTVNSYTYSCSASDPDNDNIYYEFSWGDGSQSTVVGPYTSGTTAYASHTYASAGTYSIQVRAKDTDNQYGDWSPQLVVTVHKIGDVNGDGSANVLDLIAVQNVFNTHEGDPNWNYFADQHPDGIINVLDLIEVANHLD